MAATNGLTVKQEKFAQLYVELGNASEAYRRAYNSKAKPESVKVEASKLLSQPNVSLTVKKIQEKLEEEGIWRKLDSLKVLSGIATKGEKDSDRVAAVKALNAMHGWDSKTIDHTSSDRSMSPLVVVLDHDDED